MIFLKLDIRIFLAVTKFLNPMNAIKSGKQYNFTAELEDIKNDLRSLELLFGKAEFDIFGSSVEDKTKINIIKSKKHSSFFSSIVPLSSANPLSLLANLQNSKILFL